MRLLLVGKQAAAGGLGSSTYWFNKTNLPNSANLSCSINSLNNILVAQRDATTPTPPDTHYGMYLLRYDANGNLTNQADITIDHPTGVTGVKLFDDNKILSISSRRSIFRLTSGLAIEYTREYDIASGYDSFITCGDSSGNTYVAYLGIAAGVNSVIVTKLDSSFSVVWSKSFRDGTSSSSTQSGDYINIAVNGSGTLVVGVIRTIGGSPNGAICIDSSGSLLWGRSLASRSFRGVGIDSSGNAYISLYNGTSNISNFFKIDSSGTTIWKKRLITGVSANILTVSDSGDMYVVAGLFEIHKIDTSGTYVNGRVLTYNSNNIIPVAGAVASDNKLLVTGWPISQNDLCTAFLPADNSLGGTYGLLNYFTGLGALTITNSTDTLTTFTPTVATNTDTLTSYANGTRSTSITEERIDIA